MEKYTLQKKIIDLVEKNNKIIYFKDSLEKTNYFYKSCNFHFISINISFNDEKEEKLYSLKLLNPNENYYVVGNKINRLIIFYLLKQQYNLNLNITQNYKLVIIDNNVNIKTITEKEEIVLNENDYEINEFLELLSDVPQDL